MNKSLIRHFLTALGAICMMPALSKGLPIINFLGENLDTVYAALSALGGFGLGLFGFFKNTDRFNQ